MNGKFQKIVVAATWFLLASSAYKSWTIPMQSKEACTRALEFMQKGYPHYCVNTETGEVVMK